MNVPVNVAVNVAAPVIVAVRVHGNATVGAITATATITRVKSARYSK